MRGISRSSRQDGVNLSTTDRTTQARSGQAMSTLRRRMLARQSATALDSLELVTNPMPFRHAVKGKRILCLSRELRRRYRPVDIRHQIAAHLHHDYEHGFPLIRSLRASAQRSRSVLFSFVLSFLIVGGSFVIRQSKTILARFGEAGKAARETSHRRDQSEETAPILAR